MIRARLLTCAALAVSAASLAACAPAIDFTRSPALAARPCAPAGPRARFRYSVRSSP